MNSIDNNEEGRYQEVIKSGEKYDIIKCEYSGRESSDNNAVVGVIGTVGGDNIKNTAVLAVAASDCIFQQYYGSILLQGGAFFPQLTCPIDPEGLIFGVEDKAVEAIKAVKDMYDNEMIFLHTASIADVIGVDLEGIVRQVRKQLPPEIELVYAETGGIKGHMIDGYEEAVRALIEQLMEKPKEKLEKTVNILGSFPLYNFYWEGNIIELKRIFEKLGIKVNCVFTGRGHCDVKRIKKAPQASLNVVISGLIGVESAKLMEEKFDVPYVSAERNIPIGFGGTKMFISEVCQSLDIKGYKDVLEIEEQKTKQRIIRWMDCTYEIINQKNDFAIKADSDLAIGLVDFLGNEMGWIPYVVGLTRYTDESLKILEKMVEGLSDPLVNPKPRIFLRPDDQTMRVALREHKPTFVFGSAIEADYIDFVAGEAKLIKVTYPYVGKCNLVEKTMMGYRGAISIMDEIYNSLFVH